MILAKRAMILAGRKNKILSAFLVLAFALVLVSCGESKQEQKVITPEPIASSDECHVCGMVISQFPGPKGEAFDARSRSIKKFCSTKELMLWALQPDNQPNLKKIFVHDMAQTAWDKPDDSYMIEAHLAWFVVGSDKKGSMGGTLASFAKKTDAENFVQAHGGQIYSFEQLSIDLLIK